MVGLLQCVQNGGTFYSFHEEEIGELHSKNSKETSRRMTIAIWRILAVLNNPFSPKLAGKQAIEDELNIDGGKLVCKLGIILNEK